MAVCIRTPQTPNVHTTVLLQEFYCAPVNNPPLFAELVYDLGIQRCKYKISYFHIKNRNGPLFCGTPLLQLHRNEKRNFSIIVEFI